MVTLLRKRDLEAMMAFLGEAHSIQGAAPFTTELLDELTKVIDCEFATYNQFDFARRRIISYVTCSAEGEEDAAFHLTDKEWDGFVEELSLDREVERDGIVALSDQFSRDQREAFDASPRYSREEGILDTMCVRLGPPGARFVMNSIDRDFGVRERLQMQWLRPHLLRWWESAITNARLEAALGALDREDAEGVLFIGARGEVEFSSQSARRLVQSYLSASVSRLPDKIEAWRNNGYEVPLVIANNGSNLVVQGAKAGTVLLLHEEASEASLLTRREIEVMRCVAAGLSNDEISRRLWIEVPTVRKHLEHVYDKLGVRSRTAAVAKLRLPPTS